MEYAVGVEPGAPVAQVVEGVRALGAEAVRGSGSTLVAVFPGSETDGDVVRRLQSLPAVSFAEPVVLRQAWDV